MYMNKHFTFIFDVFWCAVGGIEREKWNIEIEQSAKALTPLWLCACVLLRWSWKILFLLTSPWIYLNIISAACVDWQFSLSLSVSVCISKGSILCVDCVGTTTNNMKSSKCTKWCGHRTKDVGGVRWNIISVQFKSIFSHSPRVCVAERTRGCFGPLLVYTAFRAGELHVRQTSSYNFRKSSNQTNFHILSVWWVNESHCCVHSAYWSGGQMMAK